MQGFLSVWSLGGLPPLAPLMRAAFAFLSDLIKPAQRYVCRALKHFPVVLFFEAGVLHQLPVLGVRNLD